MYICNNSPMASELRQGPHRIVWRVHWEVAHPFIVKTLWYMFFYMVYPISFSESS